MKKVIHLQAQIVNTLTGVYDVHIKLFHKFAFLLKIKFAFIGQLSSVGNCPFRCQYVKGANCSAPFCKTFEAPAAIGYWQGGQGTVWTAPISRPAGSAGPQSLTLIWY
ncbi:hypothetical protein D7Y06_24400 [Roseburia sp. 1XD42-69]|nr:hypothetical protein D7Y06_24400 [Roseburia sp. 1XD42-69]